MALITDDCDLNNNRLIVDCGGNGDWYITVKSAETNDFCTGVHSVRISTSGGKAPIEVKVGTLK